MAILTELSRRARTHSHTHAYTHTSNKLDNGSVNVSANQTDNFTYVKAKLRSTRKNVLCAPCKTTLTHEHKAHPIYFFWTVRLKPFKVLQLLQYEASRISPTDYTYVSYATNRKVAGSNPNEVFQVFHLPNPSGSNIGLESTQDVTEMTTRNLPWG